MIETRHGLRKNDIGSCLPVGDGLVKLKVAPEIDKKKKVNVLSHEYMHFMINVVRKWFKISNKDENDICDEIGDAVEKIFKKYFQK